MFPLRYELNSYILFRRNSGFKGLISLFKQIVARELQPTYRLFKYVKQHSAECNMYLALDLTAITDERNLCETMYEER
jgi:hypothetical protein